MTDNLSSMITPEILVTDTFSKVMSLRSKELVMLDHFITARGHFGHFDNKYTVKLN